MKQQTLPWILSISAGLLLFVLTSVSRAPEPWASGAEQSGQVNLALRDIADRLLKENGDLYSPIPPVRQEGPGTYFIQLGTEVDYFQLRTIVDAVLERHRIRPDYRLSLLDCAGGNILLGFLARATDENKDVPCQERTQTRTCYDLRLELMPPAAPAGMASLSVPARQFQWFLLSLVICFPLIWYSWRRKPGSSSTGVEEDQGWSYPNNRTALHLGNQLLRIDGQAASLTYREAKLLHFFFENAGQVLERDRILEAVWKDEGIIVGRSLDVFVSRLRKKLRPDPGLQLVNVHGVGYKLEVDG